LGFWGAIRKLILLVQLRIADRAGVTLEKINFLGVKGMKFQLIIAFSILGASGNALASGVDVNSARTSAEKITVSPTAYESVQKSVRHQVGYRTAIGAYSAMGKGQHAISQNEDTLEVIP